MLTKEDKEKLQEMMNNGWKLVGSGKLLSSDEGREQLEELRKAGHTLRMVPISKGFAILAKR